MTIARQDGTPIKPSLLPHLPCAWWQLEEQIQLSRTLLLELCPSSALQANRGTHSPLGSYKPRQVLSILFGCITEILPV